MGRECHVVPTLKAAFDAASRLPNALLTGELDGEMPPGFELTNSPAQLAVRSDVSPPGCPAFLLRHAPHVRNRDTATPRISPAFRNYRATIDHLANSHDAVTLIGAGTHGDFREEDQMCCAWIADGLMQSGFASGGWHDAPSGRAMARCTS
jgi:2-phosphosulfolactate phosphatase